jgi:hypothetical protein
MKRGTVSNDDAPPLQIDGELVVDERRLLATGSDALSNAEQPLLLPS